MSYPTYPTKAHRRFLGLTLPHLLAHHTEDFVPLQKFVLSAAAKNAVAEQLTTAGRMKGGILLGYQADETLHITALLPGGYGVTDPYVPHPQYALGAIEAAQQHSDVSLDWVGNWLMAADARLDIGWVSDAWVEVKQRGALPIGSALLTVGYALEGTEYLAWVVEGEAYRPIFRGDLRRVSGAGDGDV